MPFSMFVHKKKSGEIEFSDDFNRADNLDVGNGWIEKYDTAFEIRDNVLYSVSGSGDYRDNMVYRPANENTLEVDVSIEFDMRQSNSQGIQLHARLQSDTVGNVDELDSYFIWPYSNSLIRLDRHNGDSYTQLDSVAPSSVLNQLELYKLRLRVTGTDPVLIRGWVYQWDTVNSEWVVIAQLASLDSSVDRIYTAGSTGMSYHTNLVNYDNFSQNIAVTDDFVATIATTGASETVSIPAADSGVYTGTIDWGDGSPVANVTTYDDTDLTHEYAIAGDHTVTISGIAPALPYYNDGTYRNTVKEVVFKDIGTTHLDNAFYNCDILDNITFPDPDVTSLVTSVERMFYSCDILVTLPLFDTGNVTNFNDFCCFDIAIAEIPEFDTSSGEYFNNAWRSNTQLTSFPDLDFNQALSFEFTWYNCQGLLSFPAINCALCENLTAAWRDCYNLATFDEIQSGSVTNFSEAWRRCYDLTPFPDIDTSSGENFYSTWRECTSLTVFPSLDLNNGTDFTTAWYSCDELVNFPANMFDTCAATNFTNAFTGCPLNQASIDNILISLDTAGQSTGTLDAPDAALPSASGETARTNLEGRGWTINVPAPVGGPTVVEIIVDPDNAAGTDYTDLRTAVSTEEKDISVGTGSDEKYVFRCRSSSGSADNIGVNELNFNYWTTDEANGNVIVIEPYDAANRADTEWSTSKYRLVLNSTEGWHRIYFFKHVAVHFDGIQIEQAGNTNRLFMSGPSLDTITQSAKIENCHCRQNTTGTGEAISFEGGDNTYVHFHYVNNIFDGFNVVFNAWWYGQAVLSGVIYNNSFVNGGTSYGLRIVESTARIDGLKIRNNIFDGFSNCWESGQTTTSHSGNSTSDATGEDGLVNQSNSFTSATDFQITTGDDAYQSGVNLSADPDYSFDEDMLGATRPASWSVGASEPV